MCKYTKFCHHEYKVFKYTVNAHFLKPTPIFVSNGMDIYKMQINILGGLGVHVDREEGSFSEF